MIARILSRLAGLLPAKHLSGLSGVYLSRYTVLRRGPIHVYLHRFHRGDEDAALHNHPWRWSVSLLLSGGYREDRRVGLGPTIAHRDLKPGNLNVIWSHTFHRVDHVLPDTWTLFVVGPREQDWGFWSPDTDLYYPWREFIRAKGIPIAGGDT